MENRKFPTDTERTNESDTSTSSRSLPLVHFDDNNNYAGRFAGVRRRLLLLLFLSRCQFDFSHSLSILIQILILLDSDMQLSVFFCHRAALLVIANTLARHLLLLRCCNCITGIGIIFFPSVFPRCECLLGCGIHPSFDHFGSLANKRHHRRRQNAVLRFIFLSLNFNFIANQWNGFLMENCLHWRHARYVVAGCMGKARTL